MKDKLITLKQLDQQLLPLKHVIGLPPRLGWVRTIRKALGMTIKQLAKRMNVDPSRVVKIETSEPEGAITVRTLQTVAQKLDCTFVYGFLPNQSLEIMVKQRAQEAALRLVKRTSHTMALEAQGITQTQKQEQIDDLTDELLRHSWKFLWDE